MKVQRFICDPRPREPLQVTAVRYQPDILPSDGLTLILAHAASANKETWAPLVEELFSLQSSDTVGSSCPKVLEAWAIECPNHGESAVINEADIKIKFPDLSWDGTLYARSIHAFLLSKPDGVDFSKRSLVLVGHSIGGSNLMIFDGLQNDFVAKSFILLDGSIAHDTAERRHVSRILSQITWSKRDAWPSREAAFKDLSRHPATKSWHPDVLKQFCGNGLREHPAAKFPPPCGYKGGVALACSRDNEFALCTALEHHVPALKRLHEVYRDGSRPVHLLFSGTVELIPDKLKQELSAPEPQSKRGPASIGYIAGAGHMFVQTHPKETALAIWRILTGAGAQNESSSGPTARNPSSGGGVGVMSAKGVNGRL
ncbi:hypothetical protein SCHPADRAFT_885636 [Schizopora paradoxa]|uniref:AB hydrolase-1 domain-containing protein n=1 Tax=Schizopora paradoxa TaxID=27342 RepID=A0A0H2S4Q5_9AGAM|nr:hypothetical protein SCHPADRAFT_885636 [Schizopora paradoxa]